MPETSDEGIYSRAIAALQSLEPSTEDREAVRKFLEAVRASSPGRILHFEARTRITAVLHPAGQAQADAELVWNNLRILPIVLDEFVESGTFLSETFLNAAVAYVQRWQYVAQWDAMIRNLSVQQFDECIAVLRKTVS